MLLEKFEEQVNIRPDKAAVRSEKGVLTYKFLDHCARHLGRLMVLNRLGQTPFSAALLFGHDESMVIGIIAALKAGCVYIPFDPAYPEERLLYMLNDSGAGLLIVNRETLDLGLGLKKRVFAPLSIINLDEMEYHVPVEDVRIPVQDRDAAYILYTSGTSGRPKGVVQTRRNIFYFIENWWQRFSLSSTDRIALLASFCHDGSVPDIYSALLNGATLYPFDTRKSTYLAQPGQWLTREQVTIWHSVPTLYRYFINTLPEQSFFPHLRLVILGGEAVRKHDLMMFNRHFPGAVFGNIYGQTESTVSSTWLMLAGQESAGIFIGQPCQQTEILVIDENGNEMDDMETGQIVLAGEFLSPGYLNDTETTHRVFRGDINLGRVYWTGDLGRRLSDGNIEIMGRKDFQVKIRGFRIELGEIETLALQFPGIDEAVAAAGPSKGKPGEDSENRDRGRDSELCLYLVSKNRIDTSLLREYLGRKLPDYMIPTYFLPLDKVPLTPGGKVNRQALPAPQQVLNQTYAPPRDEWEQELASLWAEVLNLETKKIGRDVNFFRLGGHSLKAIILVGRIYKRFLLHVPLAEVFNKPTVRELAAYIKQCKTGKETKPTVYAAIPRVEEKEYYPLSPAVRRLFFQQQLDGQGTGYHINSVSLLTGQPDRERLEKSFNRLILRHESLRTSFLVIADEPVQRIHRQVEFKVRHFDLRAAGAGDYVDRGAVNPNQERIITSFIRPFDLSMPPLLRVGLITLAEEEHILIVDIHHIAADGTSMGILTAEFMDLYHDYDVPLPSLKLQYRDFSQWKNSPENGIAMEKQETYWLAQFSGDIPVLSLPYDFSRPAVKSFAGKFTPAVIGVGEAHRLNRLALEQGVTLYVVLLACYYLLLAKLSGQEDIVVGTAAVGRSHPDLEPLIGMFVNTLALRNYPKGEKTVTEFLQEIKERTLRAFANQDYGLEKLVEQAVRHRDSSRSPLFDVFFTLQNMEAPEVEIQGLRLTACEFEKNTARYDLGFILFERAGQLVILVEYCTRLFIEKTIERFIGFYHKIIAAVLQDPTIRILEIELVEEKEKRRILYEFNQIIRDYPWERTIPDLFAEQVEKHPGHIAVVGNVRMPAYTAQINAGEQDINSGFRHSEVQLTYRELHVNSDELAGVLRDRGLESGINDKIVGIWLERSLELIIALLGILKAGAAYLPIDPDYPQERISYILADSNVSVLVTTATLAQTQKKIKNPGYVRNFETIYIDSLDFPRFSSSHLLNFSTFPFPASSLAYVLYTSGSTGRPKGVLVSHRNVVSLVGVPGLIDKVPGDRLLLTGTIMFDITTFEIWWPLLNGLTLSLTSKGVTAGVEALERVIVKHNISILHLIPQLFNHLATESLHMFMGLRYLLIGGDWVRPYYVNQLRQAKPGIVILHMYGPTENTTFSTFHRVNRNHDHVIPIGKPLGNTAAYIIDQYGVIVPIGIPGEICLSGDGIARGYLNKPELTLLRFIPGKFNQKLLRKMAGPGGRTMRFLEKNPPGGRRQVFQFYRTGDLAKQHFDGNIEFLGRIDSQVKIRGIRVELGEIETCLCSHKKVKEAVVIDRKDRQNHQYLCAYIVTEEAAAKSEPSSISLELRRHLSRMLPGTMIPSFFVFLDHIPLHLNGKLNRKALPDPGIAVAEQYVPPVNEREKRLVEMWSEILGIEKERIGTADNFFELGGNSLVLITLISKINREFGVDLPINLVVKTPVIKEISHLIESRKSVEEPVVLLNWPADRKLFCFPPGDGFGLAYRELAVIIDDYAVYGFNFIESEDRLKTYGEIITGLQPEGSFILLGWSAAGRLIFEVAGELKRLGRYVSDIILVDCLWPRDSREEFSHEELEFFKEKRKALEQLGDALPVDTIIRKMQGYMLYYKKLSRLEAVRANVHLILSEGAEYNKETYCWENFSRGTFNLYRGVGQHFNMLNPGAVEKNGELIREILGKIDLRK